jgi:hypothetical protein
MQATLVVDEAKTRKKARLSWYHPDDTVRPRLLQRSLLPLSSAAFLSCLHLCVGLLWAGLCMQGGPELHAPGTFLSGHFHRLLIVPDAPYFLSTFACSPREAGAKAIAACPGQELSVLNPQGPEPIFWCLLCRWCRATGSAAAC